MDRKTRSKTNAFYDALSAPMLIDANPFQRIDIPGYSDHKRGLAVSAGFNHAGEVVARPFRQGLSNLYEASSTPKDNFNDASMPLNDFLIKNHDRSIMLDVASTSPRLIDHTIQAVTNMKCPQKVCCGSRFDAVGEALAKQLPEVLHFMPRTRRARLTLNLLLNSDLPDIRPFSVINLPMSFEGLEIVTPNMVERMKNMGISLNVISNNDPITQTKLLKLGVDAMMINLPIEASDHAGRQPVNDRQASIFKTNSLKRLA